MEQIGFIKAGCNHILQAFPSLKFDLDKGTSVCVHFHSKSVSSFQGSQHSGSSLSLASTKVCSSMDEGDGPSSEGNALLRNKTRTTDYYSVHIHLFCFIAEPMDECSLVPPSIAERYKVGRTLGDGNFAVVRECVERSTGREYALKIISKDKCRGKVNLPITSDYTI